MVFKNDNRSAAKFLFYHFIITFLRNKRDRRSGWERFLRELPKGKPFARLGRYMRQSMLLAFVKSAGVTGRDVEEQVRMLGEVGQEAFEQEEWLGEEEELEIARRVMVAHGERADRAYDLVLKVRDECYVGDEEDESEFEDGE